MFNSKKITLKTKCVICPTCLGEQYITIKSVTSCCQVCNGNGKVIKKAKCDES